MDASTPVTIYISAAPDLRVERDMLARTIAELPISLAWRIQQTPAEGESVDRESLRQAEVHILIMGGDIRAPVGLEHDIVQHVGRPAFAFLKRDVIRTPAGRVFAKQPDISWRPFVDARDLSRQVQHVLSEHLVRHAPRYALTPDEVESLRALLHDEAEGEEPAEGRGADHSAVVLSRDRFVPHEGKLVDEP
jgi:hypothetical protein